MISTTNKSKKRSRDWPRCDHVEQRRMTMADITGDMTQDEIDLELRRDLAAAVGSSSDTNPIRLTSAQASRALELLGGAPSEEEIAEIDKKRGQGQGQPRAADPPPADLSVQREKEKAEAEARAEAEEDDDDDDTPAKRKAPPPHKRR
jgi:hypothetical protein